MYLSYPAIYTHVRNKHGGKFPPNSYINKEMDSHRSFNVLGKSNKDSITFTKRELIPHYLSESADRFELDIRMLLHGLGLKEAPSEVGWDHLRSFV